MAEKTQREAFYQGAHWGLLYAAQRIEEEVAEYPYADSDGLLAVLARILSEDDDVMAKLKKYQQEEN